MIHTELLEPTTNVEVSAKKLGDILIPLYRQYWDTVGYNRPFDINVPTFLDMWFSHGCRIILSTRDNTPVGFCICLIYRPVTYNTVVFHVQDMYWADEEVRDSLLSYIPQVAKIIGCDEIRLKTSLTTPAWKQQRKEEILVYTRAE